jgi:3-methyladenine DNA glycosylase AlkD
MELNRHKWIDTDIHTFYTYLETYRRRNKEEWSRKILNSKLDVLAIPTKTINEIANTILKGNYQSYLDLKMFTSYETIAIYGMIVSKIKNFDEMTYYLNIYIDVMENWAHCDLLSFTICEDNQRDFIQLSDHYLTDARPFVRRLSLLILFQMIKDSKVLPIIFSHIEKLQEENEYYVIMMAGWLLSECIILYRNQTLNYLMHSKKVNAKIVNKSIQKCRESRRLTQTEKDDLLQYKIK